MMESSSSNAKAAPADKPREICPFDKAVQLDTSLDDIETKRDTKNVHLPVYPRMALFNTARLTSFLLNEFCNDDLDKIAPHLWIMSMQSSASISPLHRQRVKGREIIVSEDPRLHLVWIH